MDGIPLGLWLTARADGKLPNIFTEDDSKMVRLVKELIMHMLCYESSERYTIKQVCDELDRLVHDLGELKEK